MASIAEKNRIGKMIAALKKAEAGNYSVALDVSSKKDEIDLLADAINKTLKKTVNRAAGKRKAKADPEITKEPYRNMLDSIQESYFETDLKGNLLFFNDAVMKDLGYTAEDLAGMNFQQLVDKENSKKVYDIFHKVFLTGEAIKGFDWQILKKDKSILDVESSVALRHDEKGDPQGFRGIVRDVTRRKQAEKELQKSEEKYSTILDSMGEAYFENDLQGKTTFVNDTACRLLGYSRDEFIGMSYRDYLTPQAAGEMYKIFHRIYETGKPILLVDYQIVRKDGTIKTYQFNATLMRDTDGKPKGFRILAMDVSEHKKSEAARRLSEEKYRNILENMEEAYLEADLKGNFVFFNDSLCRLLGYTRAELAGMNYRDCIEPQTIPGVFQIFNEIFSTDKPKTSITHELIAKDGSKKIVEMSVSLRRNSSGEPAGFHGVARDATQKIKADHAIRKNERHLRLITENIHDIIWTMDFDLRYTYISPSCFTVSGYKPEEVIGLPLEAQVPPPIYAKMKKIFAEELSKEQTGQFSEKNIPFSFEFKIIRKDGRKIWVEISASSNRDENGKPFEIVGTTRDISERKKAEEEKDKLEKQLIQAQKMETVGRLAGGVAHDFNNMLSVILGYVDLAKLRLPEGNPVLKDISEIEKAAIRSKDITAQLLAFSRKQIIAPKNINLNKMIANSQKSLTRLIGEDIDLRFHPEDGIWIIKFDPSQIEQILMNLAVNARDAMPQGGKLTIETANVRLSDAYCREHLGFTPGYYVRLAISDDGTGINKATLPYIFEPFFTTKETGKGTGLGLATVYGIVKQNGGFINVYSEPEQGTTFKMYLPRSVEEMDIKQGVDEEPLLMGSGNILLVEDDALVLQMVTNMLESAGYTVIASPNPLEALNFCEQGDRAIDLVITDVVMPIMSGRELRDRLGIIRPDIKVLFMSGYTANVIVHHGVLEEGVHFLQKPFSLKELARKLREIIAIGKA